MGSSKAPARSFLFMGSVPVYRNFKRNELPFVIGGDWCSSINAAMGPAVGAVSGQRRSTSSRDLTHVIEEQPPGPIVLVAHSMGGMAALTLAKERPELFGERIVAVALLSTAAGHLPAMTMPHTAAQLAVRLRLTIAAAWLLWLISPIINDIAPFRSPRGRQWLLHRLFSRSDPPKEAAEIMQNAWIRTPLAIAAAFYPALVTYNVPAALDVLHKIPVLIMSGTVDRAIPSERSEHLAREIGSSAHLIMVEGAGHMVNLTHPDEVNKALTELIDNLAPVTPSPTRSSPQPFQR